ncbi:MAG: MEDS domain-containing protein, partial [Gemmatimonadota bacterium]|nr:MEDS domain-containing protein [Gemmatimonadota bacterium]
MVFVMRVIGPLNAALPLGIEDDLFAFPGDHVAYFWENEEDFARGVRFLELGLREGDHCIVFGYDEANSKVLQLLQASELPVQDLIDAGHLALLGGRDSSDAMLEEIGST